jgi:hypothetical protein
MRSQWVDTKPSRDPVKLAAELLVTERGYTVGEARYGLKLLRDDLTYTRTHIRDAASFAEDFIALRRDQQRVGSELYQGIGYFWAHKYRAWMRGDAHGNGYKGIPIKKARVVIHRRFIEEGLDPAGETQRHDTIINEVFGMREYHSDDEEE